MKKRILLDKRRPRLFLGIGGEIYLLHVEIGRVVFCIEMKR